MISPMTSQTANRTQVSYCSCRMRNSDARTPNAGTTGISGSRKVRGHLGACSGKMTARHHIKSPEKPFLTVPHWDQ